MPSKKASIEKFDIQDRNFKQGWFSQKQLWFSQKINTNTNLKLPSTVRLLVEDSSQNTKIDKLPYLNGVVNSESSE